MDSDIEVEKVPSAGDKSYESQEPDDSICNVCPWYSCLNQSKKRLSTAEEEDGDPGLRKPGDYKQKQVFKGKMLLWLAYQSIGVIYGDIGTSPLYVYSSTFSAPPARDDLIGVLSIIIWSLTLMVITTKSLYEYHSSRGQTSSIARYADPLNKLDQACAHNILYITGKEQMRVKKGTNWFRGIALWIFLWRRDNTRAKIASLRLEAERVIEVGFPTEHF